MTRPRLRVAIAGGGIAGLATAIALQRAGHDVVVHERRDDGGSLGGAMLLWPNGLSSLAALGLLDRVLAGATPIDQFVFRTAPGRPVAHWHADASPLRLVFRADLLAALRSCVPSSALRTGSAITSCTPVADGVRYVVDGVEQQADLLVACDGIHSRIRRQLFGQRSTPTLHHVSWIATVCHDDTDVMPERTAFAAFGDGRRLCAARVDARRVFWYATVTAQRRPETSRIDALASAFATWHRPVVELLLAPPEDTAGPLELHDQSPPRNWVRGRVALLGDAAHACLPDLTQGAGLALDSAVELGACLASDMPIDAALRTYAARRRAAVVQAVRMSRAVASWSMSEAIHVTALRDLVAGPMLQVLGVPFVDRLAGIPSRRPPISRPIPNPQERST